ncbi:DUF7408 domain-containing protein [Chengkuizengella axinellae]|uniref:DUF7408 domain-containing protein n=1 Tax=Chengkuizengella axinellae TaxID=3064388 RepID=A0ABT9IV10_9BACL|nr:hypothetical protein [Chengkuizengella sp. 2205SS18-9]MDP5273118.1 hypothetical protein [Chengkuizengella sp. 2205SS18-9]
MIRFRSSSIYVVFVILFTISLFLGIHNEVSYAEEKPLNLQIEPANDGRVSESEWLPIKFTITNPGDDLQGEFVVQVFDRDGEDEAYVQELDLPKNTTKVFWMLLPGQGYNANNHKISFYENSFDNGDEISFDKKVFIISSSGYETKLEVGVLASDPDTINFIGLIGQNQYKINRVHLQEEDLPSEAIMLQGFDLIVINDFNTESLSDAQIQAIINWTKQGGKLMIAGGASYPKSANGFEEISPVKYTGTLSVQNLSSLENIASEEVIFNNDFTISQAELIQGNILISENETPLYAERKFGLGSVIYSAYDLSLDPIASWSGNKKVWNYLLQDEISELMYTDSVYRDVWELDRALDRFESLNTPPFTILVIVFFVYIIVVAPILYFILKVLDKREWGWWIIPSIAILSSMCIYFIGASDRNSTLAQSLSIINLDAEGTGTKLSAASVFVPKGGTYSIETNEPQHISTFLEYRNTRNTSGSVKSVTYFEEGQTNIEYRDVPYWSIRKVWMEGNQIQSFGKLQYNIQYSSKGFEGEITNLTDVDLNDLSIVMNQSVYRIGDLKAGKTVSINKIYSAQNLYNDQIVDKILLNQYGSNQYQNTNQERALLLFALQHIGMNDRYGNIKSTEPYIVGLSKDQDHNILIDGEEVLSNNLNVWIQPLDMELMNENNLYIPSGYIQPYFNTVNVSNFNIFDSNMEIGQGELIIEYVLPDIENANYSRINFTGNLLHTYFEIWNEFEQTWEPFDANIDEGASDYITSNNKIQIRILKDTSNLVTLEIPKISLEGTVEE